jgi:hypothetical protein
MLFRRSSASRSKALGAFASTGGAIAVTFFFVWLITGADWASVGWRIALGIIALTSVVVGFLSPQYRIGSRMRQLAVLLSGLFLLTSTLLW